MLLKGVKLLDDNHRLVKKKKVHKKKTSTCQKRGSKQGYMKNSASIIMHVLIYR